MKKNIFILIFILFFALILTGPVFVQAQDRELEIDYPIIDDWRPETLGETPLPAYIRYIFTLAIAVSGLIIFGALVFGGARWLSSAGNPTALKDAQNQISSALLGIIILLSSWLILTTIDPQLIVLKAPFILRARTISAPGIYLAPYEEFPTDEQIKDRDKTAYYTTYDVADIRKLTAENEKIASLKILNQLVVKREMYIGIEEPCPPGTKETALLTEDCPLETGMLQFGTPGELRDKLKCCIPEIEPEDPRFYYGVVLFDKPNMEGDCEYILSTMRMIDRIFDHIYPEPRSIVVFQEITKSEGEVKVCKRADHEDCSDPLEISSDDWKSLPSGYSKEVRSIKIDGDFLLVLRGDKKCAVFDRSIPDLKGYEINKCGVHWYNFLWATYKPCATEYHLFPTGIAPEGIPPDITSLSVPEISCKSSDELGIAMRIIVSWSQVAGAESYKIYRCEGEGCSPAKLEQTVIYPNTSWEDSLFSSGAYRYLARTYSPDTGLGSASNIVECAAKQLD